MISAEIIGTVTGCGRKQIWVLAIGAAAMDCGLLISPDAFGLKGFSERIIPGIHLLLALCVLPAVFVIGKIRKRA